MDTLWVFVFFFCLARLLLFYTAFDIEMRWKDSQAFVIEYFIDFSILIKYFRWKFQQSFLRLIKINWIIFTKVQFFFCCLLLFYRYICFWFVENCFYLTILVFVLFNGIQCIWALFIQRFNSKRWFFVLFSYIKHWETNQFIVREK